MLNQASRPLGHTTPPELCAPGHTRGPEGTQRSATEDAQPSLADAPLSGGPLVPLVRHGRVGLGEAVQSWLEARWHADQFGCFPCPLPAHEGTARLLFYEGDLRLGCCGGRWRSVGEVFAAEAYGRDALLSNIEIAIWTRRLAYEAGTFRPLGIAIPDLPDDAPDATRRAREGFVLLIGLRWRDGEHRPAPFSVRFCAAWCSLSHAQAHGAITDLVRLGVMVEADRQGQLPLYLPAGDCR